MEIVKNKHCNEKVFIHLDVVPLNNSIDFEEEQEFKWQLYCNIYKECYSNDWVLVKKNFKQAN